MIGVACALVLSVVVIIGAAMTYGNHESLRKPVIRPQDRARWDRLWIADEQTPGNRSGHKR